MQGYYYIYSLSNYVTTYNISYVAKTKYTNNNTVIPQPACNWDFNNIVNARIHCRCKAIVSYSFVDLDHKSAN